MCCLCLTGFTEDNPPVTPNATKLESLFEACTSRQDEVGLKLLQQKQEIDDGVLSIQYHRNCRSSYTSSHHIKRAEAKNSVEQCLPLSEKKQNNANIGKHYKSNASTPTNSNASTPKEIFDWDTHCFICGGVCYPRMKGSMSLIGKNNHDNLSIYSNVLEEAEKRQDSLVIDRLKSIPAGDLATVNARYHRKKGCLAAYLTSEDRRIKREMQPGGSDVAASAFSILKEEFEQSIIDDRKVYQMTTLKSRFLEIANEMSKENQPSYYSSTFKEQLKRNWPSVDIISQTGRFSDLVYSRDISVAETLKKANELERKLTSAAETMANIKPNVQFCAETDEQIVHKAVTVLRRKLQETPKTDNMYYSSDEMTLGAQTKFVPPILCKFLLWLTDDKAFKEASDLSKDLEPKLLATACDITALCTSIISPKRLGLAVHLHHEFGSRKLIEDLNALGHCVSYAELRRFLTSAAEHIYTEQTVTPSGAIVSPELVPRGNGGQLIVGAGDNWDHNERTPDGKRTTHAMTTILLSPKVNEPVQYPRIKYSPSRTLTHQPDLTEVLTIKKPTQRPEPCLSKPPVHAEAIRPVVTNNVAIAQGTELAYQVARCGVFGKGIDTLTFPSWSPFHASLATDNDTETVSNVAFKPIIMAPPNDHNTIYTTMKRMKEVSSILGQTHIPVIFDMGLLTKALEIKWSAKDELAGVILCEVGMHFLMSVFAGIGHLYGDAGLRQFLCDSDVYAAGSVQQIMSGKDFDRALMAYKLVDETLYRRFFRQFREWSKQKQGSSDYLARVDQQTNTVFEAIEGQQSSPTYQQAVLGMTEVIQDYLKPAMKEFREVGRSLSPTFMLLDDFLLKVMLPLKLYICSSRTGNWELNLFAKTCLLPLLFATNRSIYAKYMSYLILESKQLPSDIANGFSEGLLVAKLSKGPFNKVWIDYVLETTENKSLKGSGGIIGLTLRDNALARWFLARPVTAKFSMQFAESVCRISSQDRNVAYHSARKSESDLFNKNIDKMDSMFDGIFVDPFNITEPPTNLVNIATGTVAPKYIEESMLNCLDKGEGAAKVFVEDRFCVQEGKIQPKKSFYDPLPRPNVRTFSELAKNVNIKSKTVSMNPEVMYLRLLAANSLKGQVPMPPGKKFVIY